MVKLASARDSRAYGPGRSGRSRAEYMNAGVYLFATVVLLAGYVAQFSREPKSGHVLLLISLALIAAVNLHDLFAHLAGVDYRVSLVELDPQLALVEFAVPILQALASALSFLSILLIFLQEEKGYGYKRESHVMYFLIAGGLPWLLGSIHNSCQIYERSDGHVQILQQLVHLPFLLGSILFVVGAIINYHQLSSQSYHRSKLLGTTCVWLSICGSTLWFIGGLANLVKVFKMQQSGGLRLEKLRGGAYERLIQQREGQLVPLIPPEDIDTRNTGRRRKLEGPEPKLVGPEVVLETPYKDVLVHGGRS